jgi:glycosyltransferase involved in cell wall biosynthesis
MRSIGDPRLVYLKNESRKGPSGARNFGLAHARGLFVSLVDSDDQWNPNKLETQLEVFQTQDGVDAVGCGWRWLNKTTGRTRIVRTPDKEGRIDGLPRWVFNTCPEQLFRRQSIAEITFEESLWTYECMEWLIRVSQKFRSAFIPEVLVDCYDHDGERASDGHLRCLEGLEIALSMHEEFVRADQSAWSFLNLRLGTGLVVAGGDRRHARKHLLRAVRASPSDTRAWAYAVGSSIPLGDHAIRALRDLLAST